LASDTFANQNLGFNREFNIYEIGEGHGTRGNHKS
jgi:hypothetical protein